MDRLLLGGTELVVAAGSGGPKRLGALDALLVLGEADIGQGAIIQGGEVLSRAPARTPGG
jgi:hypothetical protein